MGWSFVETQGIGNDTLTMIFIIAAVVVNVGMLFYGLTVFLLHNVSMELMVFLSFGAYVNGLTVGCHKLLKTLYGVNQLIFRQHLGHRFIDTANLNWTERHFLAKAFTETVKCIMDSHDEFLTDKIMDAFVEGCRRA